MFGDCGRGKVKGVGTLNVPGMPVLYDVLYVEGLTKNLVSISQLCDGGMDVKFGKNSCSIFKGPDKFLEAKRSTDNCYVFTPSISSFKTSTRICETWHQKLGHTHFRSIQKLISLDAILGIPKVQFNQFDLCGPCQHEKQTHEAHKRV